MAPFTAVEECQAWALELMRTVRFVECSIIAIADARTARDGTVLMQWHQGMDCVWLGEVDEIVHTDIDLCTVQSIGKACIDSKVCEAAHAAIINGPKRIFQWHNDLVFLRPWFQRVWVLQEVWNAASAVRDEGKVHNVNVLCGHDSIPWWVIMQANGCLYNGYRNRKNNTMPSLWMQLFTIPRNLQEAWKVLPGSRLDILTTVLQGLDFKASDSRDRIFALLAFGQETHQIAELPPLIKPDYKKTPAEVYCDFSLWWMKKYRSLRILSAVHALRNRTWVDLSGDHSFRSDDDWLESVEQPTWTLWSNGDSTWARGTLALNEPIRYNACGDRCLDISLLETSQAHEFRDISPRFVPGFKGIQISFIKSIEPFTYSQLKSPKTAGLAKAYMHIFDPTSKQGTWRNTASSLSEAEDGFSRETVFALMSHAEVHSRNGMYPHESLPCLGRCLLKAMDNGRIGLCPSGARVGDLIVIFYGGRTPYLLRPREVLGFYSFIGEYYIDGIMHGELFRTDAKTWEEKVFCLI